MAGLLRGLRALRKACSVPLVPAASRQQAAETRLSAVRHFSEQSRSAENEAKGALPTWGYAAIGVTAGGAYWFYKQQQKKEQQAQPTHGSDSIPRKDPNAMPDAAAPGKPVPLPQVEVIDAVTGKSITTDDLKDDFGLLGMGSPGKAAAAKKQLLRMQEVIEGVDAKTNMHYTWAIFVDEEPSADTSGAGLSKLVGDFTQEQRSSKKGKTELRLKALTGEAVHKIKEALQSFTQRLKGEGKAQAPAQQKTGGGDAATLYFVDPEGDIIIEFDEETSPEDITSAIAEQILTYKRQHGGWKSVKAAKPRVA